MAREADGGYMTINHFLAAANHIKKAQALLEHALEKKAQRLSIDNDKTKITHSLNKATVHFDNYRQYIKTLKPASREAAMQLYNGLESAITELKKALNQL